MSLLKDLLEYSDEDMNIVTTFKGKEMLSPKIFFKKDDTYILKESVRESLLKIADEFINFIGIEFFIYDITLTGSLSNYNWSEYSDVDLHIVTNLQDFSDDESGIETIIKELFDSKKNLWNEQHNIKVEGYETEVYVQDINEKHMSSGVYSILNNEWVVIPEKSNDKIDDIKILQKGDLFSKKIDFLINSDEKDENKILKNIDNLRKKLKDFRQSGLESGGEYSYENLVFKLLRRNGTIQKLFDFKKDIFDKKLSKNK